ncbi:MAG: carbon-nitrogen hydrolase family protein [Thermoplasmatales archaeon]|nr:carbon-nitrogen hydrolase family protein [Thermoplasmatales archaeon]
MKITMVQSRGHVDDVTQNFYKARMRVDNIQSDVFVFPEMYCSGYVHGERMKPEAVDMLVISLLKQLSARRKSAIICGAPVKTPEGVRNAMLLIEGNEVEAHYKTMLSRDGAFDEEGVFVPGDTPTVLQRGDLRFALGFGEELYSCELMEHYAEQGVDMFIAGAAFTKTQMDAAVKVAVGRATALSMHIMLVNMVGPDSGTDLGGGSAFIGPDGEIIERCTDSSDVREIRLEDGWSSEAKSNRGKRKKPKIRF